MRYAARIVLAAAPKGWRVRVHRQRPVRDDTDPDAAVT